MPGHRGAVAATRGVSRRQLLIAAARAGVVATATTPLGILLAACANASSRSAPTAGSNQAGSAEPSTASAPAPPTATQDVRPVTLAVTGDIMLGRSVNARILVTDDRFPFNGTADYLDAFDITVGNLECVISTRGAPVPNKTFHFRADPRGFGRLAAAGFDVVSLANNHSGDYGGGAFLDMLAQLPAHGLTALGGGANLAAAHTPVTVAVRGTTVGLLGYCEVDPFSFAATISSPGHAWLDPQRMVADITQTRPHVDQLLVFMHWGTEYSGAQSAHQRALARAAVDAGADVVVGSHPHVVQPAELYHGKPIIYSLGNFVFDEMYSTDVRRGNVLALTMQGTRLLDWRLRPSYIVGTAGEPQWL